MDVNGVLIEAGCVPTTYLIRRLGVRTNEKGYIKVDQAQATNIKGVFAAGDVSNVPEKQIVVAAGEGAKAALRAHRYLQRLE